MADKKKRTTPDPATDQLEQAALVRGDSDAGAVEPTAELAESERFAESKWAPRPRPQYCAKPNCGQRPAPGSKTCANHPRWTP